MNEFILFGCLANKKKRRRLSAALVCDDRSPYGSNEKAALVHVCNQFICHHKRSSYEYNSSVFARVSFERLGANEGATFDCVCLKI